MSNAADNRAYFYNRAADQWAVTQLLQLTTRDQLHLALHILGLVASGRGDHRTLSLSRLASDLGYSRQTVKPLKARMVSARLLIELTSNGGSSLYTLGPATTSDSYQFLLQQYEDLARARQLKWPFNGSQRSGAAAINPLPDQSERSGGDQSERSGGVISQSDQGGDQPERSPMDMSSEVPSNCSSSQQAQTEAEQQAVSYGSGPARISKQPTATELAGAGQGMTIQQAALYQQQQYNNQRLEKRQEVEQRRSQQQPRDFINTGTAQASSTPELQPWDGPPVEELNEGDMLQHVDGTIAFVDVRVDRHGCEIWLCECTQDLTGLTGSMIQVFAPEHLKGWFIVESQQVDGIVSSSVESDEAEAASVLIPTGSRITVDGSLAELITIGSDWDESPDADTVLAHPPGEPSAMKRYKINTITVL